MTINIQCPRCDQPTTWENNTFRPFCSERCKQIDLGAWASDQYRVATEEPANSEQQNQANDDSF